jgi:type II secretory pathway pseudopilin PulG
VKKSLSSNNQGFTLVLVLISLAFVALLGTLILTVTAKNATMKKVDRFAKNSFYSAESALDEIKVGLSEITAKHLEIAYETVLTKYTSLNDGERDELFKETFITGLYNNLNDKLLADATQGVNYQYKLLDSLIRSANAQIIYKPGISTIEKDTANNYLILKNVVVDYTDGDGTYTSSIKTDIKITTPDMNFNTSLLGIYPAYAEYALIADNKLLVQDSAAGKLINGNIYAGKDGIVLNNSGTYLEIYADNVVTRGNLDVGNAASIKIENAKLWAQNIATTNVAVSASETKIIINGICYIADDLSLNAKKSTITLQGEYYGFGNGDISDNSSAVIVNAANAVLDFSGLSKLMLAGRAYVATKGLGFSASGTTYTNGENILTGESLAVKGNQVAYLVPKEYMSVGHNPVTWEEYEIMRTGTEVDYSLPTTSGINIRDYVNISGTEKGFSKIFYQNPITSQNMVYYYLDFKSEQKGNEYFKKYFEIHNSSEANYDMNRRIGSYVDSITLSDASLRLVGNLVTYNAADGAKIKTNTQNPDALDPSVVNQSQMLKEKYLAMQQKLVDSLVDIDVIDENSLFNSIIDIDKLKADAQNDPSFTRAEGKDYKVKTITVGEDKVVFVDNKDKNTYDITADQSGIVVATGDVLVSADYSGMILSGGIITIYGTDVKINSRSNLTDIFNLNNDGINKYFRDYKSTLGNAGETMGSTGNVDIPALITYENWKKNEY